MAQETESRIIITAPARLYYPTLLTARAYHENGKPMGKPRYSTGMIFTPDLMDQFKEFDEATETFETVTFSKVLLEVAEAAWLSDYEGDEEEPDARKALRNAIKHGGIGWPIKKGSDIAAKKDGKHAEHLDGNLVLNPGSIEDYPPVLKAKVDGKMKNLTRGLTENDAKIKHLFTGGSYAYAEINVKPTNVSNKKYLTLYLNAVVFIKPGETIGGGGGGSAADRYEAMGGEADVDPTAGNDEMPF